MKGYKNSTKTVYETESSANFAKGGKAMAKVGKVMGEFKRGTLHSGSKKGPEVKSPKQAIAIALNEARGAGAKIPMRKAEGGVVEVDLPTRAEPLKAQGLSSPKLPRIDDSRDFSTAFREARSAGDKTFSWRGKTYTTQLASETRSAPKAAAPAPKAAAPAPAPKAAAPAPAPKAAAPAPKAAAPAPKAKPSFGQRVRDSYQSKEENDKEWSDRFSGVKDYLAKGDPKYRGMSRKDAFRAAFRDSMGKAEGGKVKAPPPKAKPYDPVKDEPTSRPLTADQVRNLRNQMKANPPKKPAKRPYDPVLDEPTSRPFKTGGYVKKQAGGLMAERELGAREMVGKRYGGKVLRKAEGGPVPPLSPYAPPSLSPPTTRSMTPDEQAKMRLQQQAMADMAAESMRKSDARDAARASRVSRGMGPVMLKAKGGAVKGSAAKAVHKHERNMHPGKPLTKMRNGGKVGC